MNEPARTPHKGPENRTVKTLCHDDTVTVQSYVTGPIVSEKLVERLGVA